MHKMRMKQCQGSGDMAVQVLGYPSKSVALAVAQHPSPVFIFRSDSNAEDLPG